jgi:hypothetical protein
MRRYGRPSTTGGGGLLDRRQVAGMTSAALLAYDDIKSVGWLLAWTIEAVLRREARVKFSSNGRETQP